MTIKFKKVVIIPLILVYCTFCLFASFAHFHSEHENHHILSNEGHHGHTTFYELFHAHLSEIENITGKDYFNDEQHLCHTVVDCSAHYPNQGKSSIQFSPSYLLKVKLNLKKIDNFINSPELPPPKLNLFSMTFFNIQCLNTFQSDISKASGLSPPNLT